jgi:hypothetical protein
MLLDCRGRCPIGLLFLLITFARGGSTIYVDHRRGNDRRDGVYATVEGFHTGPVRTVQAALRRVSMGGKIVVVPTSTAYTESFVVEGSRMLGSERQPLLIDGGGSEWVGWRPVPDEWRHRRDQLYRLDIPTQTFTRLFRDGVPVAVGVQDADERGMEPRAGEGARFETRLFLSTSDLRMPRDEELWGSSAAGGVVFHGASHVILQNFVFRGYRIDAIQMKGICRDLEVRSCEIHHSGRGGIYVGSNAEVSLQQVLIQDVPEAGVIAEDHARLTVRAMSVLASGERIRLGRDVRLDDDGSEFRMPTKEEAEAGPDEETKAADPLPGRSRFESPGNGGAGK